MAILVAPIITGKTEKNCIKPLLSKVWRELLRYSDLETLSVLQPIPANQSSLIIDGHPELGIVVERAVRDLNSRVRRCPTDRGWVLLLLDAEEDCPARLAPPLLARAKAIRTDADIACVFAKRELENWFKAAAASLAGVIGLPDDLMIPSNPEEGSGDTWLSRQIKSRDAKRKYTKPADAIELVQRMDC